MSERMMHVRFDKDTGDIIAIAGQPQVVENSIPVPLSEVRGILDGVELADNYQVLYNPKTKEMEFKSRHDTSVNGDSINDFIYEVPTKEVEDPDVQIIQDVPNTCWKVVVGQTLKDNLRKKGITLNQQMMLSVTAKGDPNILYKTMFVDLGRVIAENYAVLPFTMPFEKTAESISVYTSRRFDTYHFKRIFDEQ